MRPLSMPSAEGFVVISCGKSTMTNLAEETIDARCVDCLCDRVKISRSDGRRPLILSSGCDCIVEEDGESSRHDHPRE
jgi:hypothetical protein